MQRQNWAIVLYHSRHSQRYYIWFLKNFTFIRNLYQVWISYTSFVWSLSSRETFYKDWLSSCMISSPMFAFIIFAWYHNKYELYTKTSFSPGLPLRSVKELVCVRLKEIYHTIAIICNILKDLTSGIEECKKLYACNLLSSHEARGLVILHSGTLFRSKKAKNKVSLIKHHFQPYRSQLWASQVGWSQLLGFSFMNQTLGDFYYLCTTSKQAIAA